MELTDWVKYKLKIYPAVLMQACSITKPTHAWETQQGSYLRELAHAADRVQVGLPERPDRQHRHQQRQNHSRQRLIDAHVQQRRHDSGAEGRREDQASHPPVGADGAAGAPRGEAPRLLNILLLPARI